MNEQVRKLVLEATSYQWIPGTGTLVDFDQELFARLIVQECIQICNDTNDASYLNGVVAGRKIKEHFGVE